MRLHPYWEQHERLLEIIRNYGDSDVVVELQCYLGDLDLTDQLEEGEISIDAPSSPAWTFNGTFSDRLDIDYRNAPLRIVADIDGIELELFRGRASLPIHNEDNSTSVVAGTPGIFLDKVTLDERVTYNNVMPQRVIRDAVYRAPYDRGRVRIPPFETPLINRGLSATNNTGDADAFEDDAHPIDIITSVQDEVDFVFYDTPLGGFVALPNPGIGEGLPISWDYETDTHELLAPFKEPTFATPDEQPFRVVVRDKYENGDYRVFMEWPVDYSRLKYPPAAAATLYLPISSTSPEAQQEARQNAFDTARKLRDGTFNNSSLVAFNPLFEPYDVVSFRDEHFDVTGRWRKLWQALIQGIALRWTDRTLETDITYTATLLRKERILEGRILADLASPGVASTPIAGFVLGLDYIGEWVDPSHISGPLWAGEDSTGDFFDAALAPAGLLGEETVNGELLDYIDYVSAAGATYGEDEIGEWVDDTYISDPQWSGTEIVASEPVALDYFEPDYAPLGLLGEDGTGEYIDF